MSSGYETSPTPPDSAPGFQTQECFALVIAGSREEPYRAGELARFPELGVHYFVGREADAPDTIVHFVRQRPHDREDEEQPFEPLKGDAMSRKQLEVWATKDTLEIKVVGQGRTFVNGQECARASLRVGDTVLVQGAILLQCVRRPLRLPRIHPAMVVQPFGEADANGIVGESHAIWRLRDASLRVALTDDPVLVLGETGTGKELAAAAIHRLSARREGTFLVANAATTETLFEAEFNGNVKGFPTGASARLGWARAADGGTLCFDEIGDMPLPNQAKLLRFMQSGAIRVVGEDGPRNVNVRVIGATNKDMGSLRGDFFRRFKRRILLVPLRERREDIPLLVRHLVIERARLKRDDAHRFLRKINGRMEVSISLRFLDYLVRHPLLGNMRELEAKLIASIAETEGDVLALTPGAADDLPEQSPRAPLGGADYLPAPFPHPSPSPPPARASNSWPATGARSTRPPPAPLEPKAPTEPRTKDEVVSSIEQSGGNLSEAARLLGLSRGAFYRLLDKYEITRPSV